MNDYKDIESARFDDICNTLTLRFWEWVSLLFCGCFFFFVIYAFFECLEAFLRNRTDILDILMGAFRPAVATGVALYWHYWGWKKLKRDSISKNLLLDKLLPIRKGMILPDGTTIPTVPFHPKEMFFLGKICEFGPQTQEEHTFVNQWKLNRHKDWICYTHIEALKQYRKNVTKYQQQMARIEEAFCSSTYSRIKNTSLENAFIFYSLAAKSEFELPNEYKIVTDTFSHFYATIPSFPPALLKLSEFYKLGLGCKPNKKLSEKLFQQWLNIIKDGALQGNDEMKRYLFRYYVAHPQEHLDNIINFALKGEVDMVQLLVNYYSQIGDIDHRDYWASRLS